MSELIFPVLWINKLENSLGVFLDQDQLTSCSPGSQSFFKDLLLVSPNGFIREVEGAIKIGKAKNASPGLPNILSWLGLGLIRVELGFKSGESSRSLQKIIELVLDTIKADSEFWDSDGDIDGLIEKISASRSFEELVEIMKKRCWPDF